MWIGFSYWGLPTPPAPVVAGAGAMPRPRPGQHLLGAVWTMALEGRRWPAFLLCQQLFDLHSLVDVAVLCRAEQFQH